CGAPVRAFDNIPIISYATLGGRCRSCRARISVVYPMVELLTGLMFVALVFKTGPSWEALLEFAFPSLMIALIFIYPRHHMLPNVITDPAFLFALTGATARAGWGDQFQMTFDISIIIPGLQSGFTPWRAALFGGLLFAMAAPGFWLLDRLDPILFGKYFDWEETDEIPWERRHPCLSTSDNSRLTEASRQGCLRSQELSEEMEIERRHDRAIRATMILGVVVATAWAAVVIFSSAKNEPAIEDAYGGLLRASAGAMIIGGLIWSIRAAYFF